MQADHQKRLQELILRAKRTGKPVFSLFLDPVQAGYAQNLARKEGVTATAWGGYEDAERRVTAFYEGPEAPSCEDFPLECLRIGWDDRYEQLAHPDVLGALMGLGLSRDRFGYVVMERGSALVFTLIDSARIIAAHLVQAGRAQVTVSQENAPRIEPMTGALVSATFQSLRLDAVVAEAFHMGRGAAAQLVESGRVLLNYQECLKPDAHIKTNDVVTVRQKGRIHIGEVGGQSKKGRTYLSMEVFARR